MSLPPSFRRLSAALSVCFLLCAAIPVSSARRPQFDQAIPAVSAPDLWARPRAFAPRYEEYSRRLTQLGLSSQDIALLWNRAGELTSPLPEDEDTLSQQVSFLIQPGCRKALLSRYSDYAQAHPELSAQQVVLTVNMELDRTFYEDIQPIPLTSGQLDTGILVTKFRALSPDYKPPLVPLSGLGAGSLTPEAAAAFSDMVQAARQDGITLRSVSAYRSYSTQERLYRRYRTQYSQSFTDTFSARPGHSEHQTGLALDINTASSQAHFEKTRDYAWLVEHCAQYGFILRYPKGKESVTGYRFEPWHYRYVGTEIAQICMDQGWTLEEYWARQPSGWGNAPQIIFAGQALAPAGTSLRLGETWYFPVTETALALGWSGTEDHGAARFVLGEHQLECLAGQRCRIDGVTLRLTHPSLSLGGRLYLPASDLCAALGADLLEPTESSAQAGRPV